MKLFKVIKHQASQIPQHAPARTSPRKTQGVLLHGQCRVGCLPRTIFREKGPGASRLNNTCSQRPELEGVFAVVSGGINLLSDAIIGWGPGHVNSSKLFLSSHGGVGLIGASQNVVQGVLVNGSMGKVIDFMTIGEALKRGLSISAPSNNSEGYGDDLDSYDGLEYDEDSNLQIPPTQPPQYQYRTYIEEHILASYDADPTIAKRPTQLRYITNHTFLLTDEYPLVHFTNDRKLLCVPMFFDRVGLMGNIEARRVQVPLILSWAITIHKSQGQTLDFVKVDFENIFADGQGKILFWEFLQTNLMCFLVKHMLHYLVRHQWRVFN